MNMYEFNQIGYASIPAMTEEELRKAAKDLRTFLQHNVSMYYLLLNNESRYYTIFTYDNNTLKIKEMSETILDIVADLGQIKAIEFHEDKVEFWVIYENECKVFYLFNYEKGVVEV